MGELSNLWLYQEDTADLKMKLQNTRMELEAVRNEVKFEKEQTREKQKQLHELIQMVYNERDEAREQLQNLLNKINPSLNVSTLQPHLMVDSNDQLHHKLVQVQQPRANSSITESNTLSDTYNNLNNNNNNNHSYVSSPVDSIFDAVTSPDFSTFNNNMVSDSGTNNNNVAFFQDMCQSHVVMSSSPCVDQATVVIDGLVKGKVLPQKGKLLEAVMEAGPLLQTLMLAGPLPRWRNPPPIQPFKIPQMAAIAAVPDHHNHHHHSVAAPMKASYWTTFAEMSCGSSSNMETNNNFSVLNFSNGGVNNERLLMNMNTQIPVGKRQRLM